MYYVRKTCVVYVGKLSSNLTRKGRAGMTPKVDVTPQARLVLVHFVYGISLRKEANPGI